MFTADRTSDLLDISILGIQIVRCSYAMIVVISNDHNDFNDN